MKTFILKDEFIKLGQLLKAVGIAENGLDAKDMILSGDIFVNGEPELRRGKKLVAGDHVQAYGEEITIK